MMVPMISAMPTSKVMIEVIISNFLSLFLAEKLSCLYIVVAMPKLNIFCLIVLRTYSPR